MGVLRRTHRRRRCHVRERMCEGTPMQRHSGGRMGECLRSRGAERAAKPTRRHTAAGETKQLDRSGQRADGPVRRARIYQAYNTQAVSAPKKRNWPWPPTWSRPRLMPRASPRKSWRWRTPWVCPRRSWPTQASPAPQLSPSCKLTRSSRWWQSHLPSHIVPTTSGRYQSRNPRYASQSHGTSPRRRG